MAQPPRNREGFYNERQVSRAHLPPDAEEARQRRIETLRELARSDTAGASPPGLERQRYAPVRPSSPVPVASGRRLWPPLVGSALAIILIAAGVSGYILTRPHMTTTHSLPAVVTITSAKCAANVAWSPDGNTLAALEIPCSNIVAGAASLYNATVRIYNASRGTIQYQTPIAAMLGANAANYILDGLGWSLDSKYVVLEGNATSPNVGSQADYTLLLIPAQGGAIHALQATLPDAYSPDFAAQLLIVEPVWNLRTQGMVNKTPVPTPAALSYRLTEDGRLVAQQPFATPGASAYAGRGGSDGTVPFWQDGSLIPLFPRDGSGYVNSSAQPLAVDYLSGPTAVWSPDGMELTFATFSGLLAAAQPLTAQVCAKGPESSSVLIPMAACPGPAIAPPNAAVAALVAMVLHPVMITSIDGTTSTAYLGVSLAWSPHRAALATIEPLDLFSVNGLTVSGKRTTTVTLLATANGHAIGQRSYTCQAASCFTPLLAWSPTGALLALVDDVNGITMLWNTRQVKG